MFVMEVDINNALLLKCLFEVVQITPVMHLAAQVGSHNAMRIQARMCIATLLDW
jgi:UDP-glucose 4-epimerase